MAKNSRYEPNRGGGAPQARQRPPQRRHEGRAPSAGSDAPTPGAALIWGFHAVREALRSPRRKFAKLYATAQAAERLHEEIAARGLTPIILEPREIDARLPPDAPHQGLLLEARALEPIDLGDLPADGVVLVLDQITDPHNVGAILRTAAAFGIDAIITTERHSPALTGALAKAASGGLEHVPICPVVNLARTLEELADMGYQRIGLDSQAEISLGDTALARPLALALGAEGKGLRRLTRENCDTLARLDLPGPIKSLNVSNACAVALTLITMKLPPRP